MKSKDEPLVSILVPVYNVELYIDRCLDSLFEQTYKNIEYIFVDDCSKDNSIYILNQKIKKYPNLNIQVINHEINKGLAGARLTALKAASGIYVWNIDSDDYIKKDALEYLVNILVREKADVVAFNYIIEDNDGLHKINRNFGVDKIDFLRRILSLQCDPCIWGEIVKLELYKKYNIFPIEGLDFSEDYSVTPRLFYNAGKIYFCNNFFYFYNRLNATSYVNDLKPAYLNSFIHSYVLLWNFYSSKTDFKKYKSYYLIGLIEGLIKLKNSSIFNEDIIGELKYIFKKNANILIKLNLYLKLNKLDFISRPISRFTRIYYKLM